MKYPSIVYRYGEKIFPHKKCKPFTRFLKTYYKDRKKLIGCEIGVWNGNNARNIMDSVNVERMYLIDPYITEYDINDKIVENRLKYNKNAFYQAKKILKKYGDKCKFILEKSENAFDIIPDFESFDFIYLDGNHNYKFVKKDIDLYFPLVKVGGVFGGHDYLLWNGVHKAVDDFLNEQNLNILGYAHDWWVIK